MTEPRALAFMLLHDAYFKNFSRSDFAIRQRMPLSLGEFHRPEPGIAIVKWTDLSRRTPPFEASIIIEVSDSTLHYDRSEKASLYAKADFKDYWILNLVDRVLEVRRAPRVDTTASFGFSYGYLQTYTVNESVSPLAVPESVVNVNELFS